MRVVDHEPRPAIDLVQEGVAGLRWWTPDELAESDERFTPPDLLERLRNLTL